MYYTFKLMADLWKCINEKKQLFELHFPVSWDPKLGCYLIRAYLVAEIFLGPF